MSNQDDFGRILAVDDEEPIRVIVKRVIEQLGFTVDCAENGSEALKYLKNNRYDLVISDLMMPGVSGQDLIQTIKGVGLEVDVLFVSAVGSIPEIVELMKLGAVGFLEKPFTPAALKREVLAALREHQSRRSLTPSMSVGDDEPLALPDPVLSDSQPLGSEGRAGPDEPPLEPDEPPPGAGMLSAELLQPITQLGRYQVQEVIGEGGMGAVYRAHDPVLNRDVALKVMRISGDQGRDSEWHERFAREARAAGSLQHPAIVQIHDFGRDPVVGCPFLVMELMPGKSLGEVIRAGGPLAARRTVRIVYHLADALRLAHSRGVVHRDIKPDNIILLAGDRPKLIDFGLARLDANPLTRPKNLVGSPAYLSPEAARAEPIDSRADQFSLGIVMFEMWTGKRIFEAKNVLLTVRRICEMDPPALADMGFEVPPSLQRIARRMLQKDRKDRYQDDEELVSDLSLVAAELEVDVG